LYVFDAPADLHCAKRHSERKGAGLRARRYRSAHGVEISLQAVPVNLDFEKIFDHRLAYKITKSGHRLLETV
jgi:hypothetical protein